MLTEFFNGNKPIIRNLLLKKYVVSDTNMKSDPYLGVNMDSFALQVVIKNLRILNKTLPIEGNIITTPIYT